MQKRRVVVTGAAGGIGWAIVQRFEADGHHVAIIDRDQEALDRLPHAPGRVLIGCDVSEERSFEDAIETARRRLGGIDVWVSNAGFQHVAPIESFPTDVFRRMLEVMVVAPFVALRSVLPEMRSRGWGRVIHIASINALVGFEGKAGYNTAKHALIGLTRVAALEAASAGVTVNAICPGYVDTPLVRGQLADLAASRGVALERVLDEVILSLVPQRRLLRVDEVAESCAYVASEAAAAMTGHCLVLDGGYTVR
jgi:3-hydroxybutyrate dehydrogenase